MVPSMVFVGRLFLAWIAFLVLLASPARAVTTWTDWTSATTGAPGSASGSVGGVSVNYSGLLIANGTSINGTSGIWAPNSTFSNGTTVTASPSVVNDSLGLDGNPSSLTNTITFGSAVTNPLIAIWSLGAPGSPAVFNFNATPTLLVGGPNSQFGGASISVNGNQVLGSEGNGVVQFTGAFSSISWTNTPEFFYAFTVGLNGPTSPSVPEPASLTLVLIGASFLGVTSYFRKPR
jgi:hypothetical protein